MDRRISLIPFKNIFSLTYMRRKIFLWIVFFGMTPIIILYLNTYYSWKFEHAAWVLGSYFCMVWGINFYILIRPRFALWSTGIGYALFTALLGVPLLLAMQQLGLVSALYATTSSNVYIFRVIGFVFGVGLLEETCKFLPVALFGIRRNKVRDLREALYLGAMSGLGFALAEAVHYTIMYWQNGAIISLSEAYQKLQDTNSLISSLTDYYGSLVMIQLVRFMTLPLFHAIWSAIVSWFAMSCKLYGGNRRNIVVIGIFFMAAMHGFYDVYSGNIIGILIAFLSIMIFMGYLNYSQKLDYGRTQ